jgi:hypothetical protein
MSDIFGSLTKGMGGLGINCGTKVIGKCKDLKIPWGEDWTFQMLFSDLIDAA